MEIIPVIDLLHGNVVRAERGRRQDYRPWRSSLCPSADPIELVHTLHMERRFSSIYVADLDAIQQRGDHRELLLHIAGHFPTLELWIDGGFRVPDDLARIDHLSRVRAVIGSETWRDTRARPHAGALLSIDSDAHGPRDPSGICDDPTRRPDTLILMNLDRVGSDQGPDIGLLGAWRTKASAAQLYLAGGIRNEADLATASNAGAHGVLVASALHDGSLDKVSDIFS